MEGNNKGGYVQAQVLRGHQGHVQCVRFNRNGQYALSAGNDKTIRLWNPAKGLPIKVFKGHSYEVLDLDVSIDNAKIASCGEDKQLFVWDVVGSAPLRRFKGHASRINAVRFNSDSSMLVTGSYDRTVKLWDCRSNTYDAVQTMEDAKDSVSSVFVSGYQIFSASIDTFVRTYDIRMGRLTSDNIGYPATSISESHDGNCLLVSTLDNTVRLLDKTSGELLGTYKGHVNTNYKIDSCLSNSDALIISGSENGLIYVWNLVEANVVQQLQGHSGTVCGICVSPVESNGGTPLLSSSADGTVRYWTWNPSLS